MEGPEKFDLLAHEEDQEIDNNTYFLFISAERSFTFT